MRLGGNLGFLGFPPNSDTPCDLHKVSHAKLQQEYAINECWAGIAYAYCQRFFFEGHLRPKNERESLAVIFGHEEAEVGRFIDALCDVINKMEEGNVVCTLEDLYNFSLKILNRILYCSDES